MIANFRQFCLWLLENIRFHIDAKKLNRALEILQPPGLQKHGPIFEIELTDLSNFLRSERVLS